MQKLKYEKPVILNLGEMAQGFTTTCYAGAQQNTEICTQGRGATATCSMGFYIAQGADPCTTGVNPTGGCVAGNEGGQCTNGATA